MKRIGASLVVLLFVAHFIAFPATAGMDKIVGGSAHSIAKGMAKAHKNIKARQEEKKRIRIELESQFSMGYLLSLVHYDSTTNSPTGYVRVGGGNLCGIWEYFPADKRNVLIENWNTAAKALHDRVLKCYETIQADRTVYADTLTTFTNAYSKFTSDVDAMLRYEGKEKHVGLLNVDVDFKQMIGAGAEIIHKVNDSRAGKDSKDIDSMDIVTFICFCMLGILIVSWVTRKVKMFADKCLANKRFDELVSKIDGYSVDNGLKKIAIVRLGKEVYIRFQTKDQGILAIAHGAKPNKGGSYLCSWALQDPKDDDFYYVCQPTDYQILFNPDTGEVEMRY